jgi:1,4-alpha-glucan branching enzyme
VRTSIVFPLIAALLVFVASSTASATDVTFRFRPEPGAVTVSVAGYFNEWNLAASPLVDADGDGLWELTADLSPGRHPYKFVVDGSEWVTDASAPEFEDDGFGGQNSVLVVGDAPLVVEAVPADPSLGSSGEVVAKETAVRFRFHPDAEAKSVSVAGTFNDWSTSASPMAGPDPDGVYETVFRLTPGRYLYKFVADGTRWFTDETASSFEEDGFGGQNSVLEVGRAPLIVGEPVPGEDSAASLDPLVVFRLDASVPLEGGLRGSTPSRPAPGSTVRGSHINAVSVAGTFNGWNAAARPMSDGDGDGIWEVRFRLPAGEYAYQFVVDGDTWITDPFADVFEDDGFGGRNARLVVGRDDVLVGAPR